MENVNFKIIVSINSREGVLATHSESQIKEESG
jgi:hypothetical protein